MQQKNSGTDTENEIDQQLEALKAWFVEKFKDAKLIDIAQIVIGVFVVGLGIFGACIYSGQLEQMKTTNRLTQEALDINSRPWVGIENPANMPIVFRYDWPVVPPLPGPSIMVDLRFNIKNYGSSTARVLDPTIYLDYHAQNQPQTLIRQTCQIDKYRTPGQVTIQGDVGESCCLPLYHHLLAVPLLASARIRQRILLT
jgi:hypothetical protein